MCSLRRSARSGDALDAVAIRAKPEHIQCGLGDVVSQQPVATLIDQHDGSGARTLARLSTVATVAPAKLLGAGWMSVTTKFRGQVSTRPVQ